MVQRSWYSSIRDPAYLKELKDDPKTVVLAQDHGTNDTKRYKTFGSHEHFVAFLMNETNKVRKHYFYEMIKDNTDTPVYLYLDIDRPYYSSIDRLDIQKVLTALAHMIETRLEEDCEITLKLEEGVNYQVAQSCRKDKFSVHLKVDVVFANVVLLKQFVTNLRGMVRDRQEWTEMFQYVKTKSDGSTVPDVIIDNAVYKNGQLYRLLYSSKLSKGYPLLPYGKSSTEIKDHMVVYHPDNDRRPPWVRSVRTMQSSTPISIPTKPSITLTRMPEVEFTSLNAISEIPHEQVKNVCRFIENDRAIQDFIGGKFALSYKYPRKGGKKLILLIDHKDGHRCKYAGRCHKSNHDFFEYHHPSQIVQYKCFDEDCIKDWSANGTYCFKVPTDLDGSSFVSHNTLHTIHDKGEIVKWDESYSLDRMKPYPLLPLVVVMAQMGLGKTVALKEYFANHLTTKATSCLVVSYSINLCMKYKAELCDGYKFEFYLDNTSGVLDGRRTIVCLDSLYKVARRKFDFVIIDECVSVFDHINADTMTKRAEVMDALQEILLKAKHTVLLDAGADNCVVHSVVEYLADKTRVSPYWIRNTFVRPHNRRCKIYVKQGRNSNKDKRDREFESCILTYIHGRIEKGKNLVIPCASKTIATEISRSITEKYGEDHAQILYTSETDREIKKTHFQDPDAYWGNYTVLTYSPTVSAGVSYCPQEPHYHELVAVMENSWFVPNVMGQLQMLMRVRQLIDGRMTLFVRNNAFKLNASFPVVDAEIEAFLEENVNNLDVYYPKVKNADGKRSSILNVRADTKTDEKTHDLRYDKGKLSYALMTSIVKNHHKSMLYFVEILCDTLTRDYRIPIEKLDCHDAEYEFHEKVEPIVADDYSEWNTYVIDKDEYDTLCDMEWYGYELPKDDRIRKQVFKVLVERYEISSDRLDEPLVMGVVRATATQKTIRGMYARLWKRKRLHDCLTKSGQENRRTFDHKLACLLEEQDDRGRNRDLNVELALLRKKPDIKNTEKLVLGQEILHAVVPNYKELESGDVVVTSGLVYNRLGVFVQNKVHADKWFGEVQRVFDLDKQAYGTIEKVIDNYYCFVKNVFNDAFGIVVSKELFTTNPNMQGYGTKDKITFSVGGDDVQDDGQTIPDDTRYETEVGWREFRRKYNPFSANTPMLQVVMNGYSFLEEEDVVVSLPSAVKELI